MSVGSGTVRAHDRTSEVDRVTARELLSAARDLASAVTEPGIGRSERLSRASLAAERVTGLPHLAGALDPYAAGRHSRLLDLLHEANSIEARALPGTRAEAVERLDLARQSTELRQQMRALEIPQLHSAPVATHAMPATLSGARWLDTYALPATGELGPSSILPEPWSNLPDAVIGAQTPIPDTLGPLLGGTPSPWTVSKWGFTASLQLLDWTVDEAAEVERMTAMVVDRGLERELLRQVTAGAPVAASLQAAEVAVGQVWTPGADVILCAGTDRPKLVREYAADGIDPADRPALIPTAGATEGTAVMMATAAVYAEASGLLWMVADRPKDMSRDMVAYRYGKARRRLNGAVQLVTVA